MRRRRHVPVFESCEPWALLATLSILDFGAVAGDGLDDAPAIQAAIDAVSDDGATVHIPTGLYNLGSSLLITRDHTRLEGEGPGSILRTLTHGIAAIELPVPEGNWERVDGVEISDFTLEGAGLGYFGILARQATDLTISSMTFDDWLDAISVSNGNRPSEGVVIENNTITSSHRNGLHLGYVDGAIVRGNRITDTPTQKHGLQAGNGIDIEVEGHDLFGPEPHIPSVRNVLIEDNYITRTNAITAGAGIAVQPAYGPTFGVTIRGNFISGHQRGVETTGELNVLYGRSEHDQLTIEDNWITVDPGFSVVGYPILIVAVSGGVVRGNTFNDLSANELSPWGFLSPAIVTFGSEDILVSDNTMYSARYRASRLGWISGVNERISFVNNACQVADRDDFPLVLVDPMTSDSEVTISGNVSLDIPWDHTAPTVTIGETGSDGLVPVTASDSESEIVRVLYFVDGVPVGHQDSGPFGFTFDPAKYAPGTHTLSVIAIDAAANESPEISRSILVSPSTPPPPPVAITEVTLENGVLAFRSLRGASRISVFAKPGDPSIFVAMVDGVAREFVASAVLMIRFDADGDNWFENLTSLNTWAELRGNGNRFARGRGRDFIIDWSYSAIVTSPFGQSQFRWDLGFVVIYL